MTVLAPALSAQDVITLKNGDEIQAKVTKVGDNEIEYKKWSNQNGPTYSKPISEIFMIKYENGEKEVYNQTNNNQQQQQQLHLRCSRWTYLWLKLEPAIYY